MVMMGKWSGISFLRGVFHRLEERVGRRGVVKDNAGIGTKHGYG